MTVLFGTVATLSPLTPPPSSEQHPQFNTRTRILVENGNPTQWRGGDYSAALYGSLTEVVVQQAPKRRVGSLARNMGGIYFDKVRLFPNPLLIEQSDVGYDPVDGYIRFTDSATNVSDLWVRGNRTALPQQYAYAAWSTYFDRTVVTVSDTDDFRLATTQSSLAFGKGEYKTDLQALVIAGDATIPVITILGANPQAVQPNEVYPEFGATAFDAFDGDLTDLIVTDSSAVNTAVEASYQVFYSVSDPSGNYANVARDVVVADTLPPIISLIGSPVIKVEQFASYVDQGATAFDLTDGDVTGDIVTVDTVDTDIKDSYIITYNVSDSKGNAAIQVTRRVEVGEYFGITLKGRLGTDEVVKSKLYSAVAVKGNLI